MNKDALAGIKNTICHRCFKKCEETKSSMTPMEELEKLLKKSINGDEVDQLCPDCKKELGILNLLGFAGRVP